MKTKILQSLALACGLLFGGTAYADLLGVGAVIDAPNTTFFSGNQTSQFTGSTLSIRATLSETDGVAHPQPSSLSIDIVLNHSNGALVGGVSGDDFKMQDATGVLLTGEILAFGFLDTGGNSDFFDFRFKVTGGSLASQYAGKDIGVTVTLENSNFTGFPGGGFSGLAKGNVGSIPPLCAGEIGDFVWNDLNMNGIQDANEPGIDNVTVTLKDSADTTLATTTTSFNGTIHGFYHFTGLCAGTYKVEVTNPTGFGPTIENAAGSTTANDSNHNPATVILPADNSIDLTIDFGFVQGQLLCPPGGTTGGGSGTAGTLSCTEDPVTHDVHCLYRQSTNLNDNSYGANAVGWGTRGHTFSNLTGSDRAQFIVKDGQGHIVANFTLDYISTKTGTASGYGSLGPFGGDGSCLVGCTGGVIKDWNSSLAHNLNDHGFCSGPNNCTFHGVNLLVNSPPTFPSNTYNVTDPAFAVWDFYDTFEFTISGAAFAGNGFGGITGPNAVTVPFIHNSPAKSGSNLITPGPCPEQLPGECHITPGTLQFSGKQVKLQITNDGTATITLSGLNLTFPGSNGKLKKVKLGGDTLFSGSLSSPATLTSANLTSNVNKKSINPGVTRVLIFEFEKNVSTKPGDYSGTIKFGDGQGCSISLPQAQPQCEICQLDYPYSSSEPRTNVVFTENEVLEAFSPNQGCIVAVDQTIKVWASDETAMLLGVHHVIVKDQFGSTTYDFSTSPGFSSFPPAGCTNPANGCGVINPKVGTTDLNGDKAGTDVSFCPGFPDRCDRPVFPSLFITDITSNPLICTPGYPNNATECKDWQFGGTPVSPHAIFGAWKGAIRTVDKTHSPPLITVTPDSARNVPAKNGWNLNPGDPDPAKRGDPVPAGTPNLGYGTEVRWNVNDLINPANGQALNSPSNAGHRFRIQVMVHDGDQNKSGGDVGEACVNIRTP
jgi:hypothetical protein